MEPTESLQRQNQKHQALSSNRLLIRESRCGSHILGPLLSVGSYDATLRIYTASAELYFESRLHKVSTVRWRMTGTKNCRSLSGPYIRDALF